MALQVSDERRPWVIAAIMLGTFMVAVEQTIVATAMPSIVSQLGGFSHYSWVFSAFLVPQTTTTVIWGKLADMFGRKPVLICGMTIFLIASILCGCAWSMGSLIAFRALQGIGAGCIQPVNMTVVGDLYRLEERGKIQGFVSSTWVVSSIVGPLIGGIIVKYLPWAWVFWLNLPLALLAMTILGLSLRETLERRTTRIDYIGALLFAIAIVALLVLLSEPEASTTAKLTCAGLALAGGITFIWWERRAAEPIVSIALWTKRLIATCNILTMLLGMVLFGLNVMLPVFLQGVLGYTPIEAGLVLTALVAGWPAVVTQSKLLFGTFGLMNVMRGGAMMMTMCVVALLFFGPGTSNVTITFIVLLLSIGMGLAGFTAVVMTQEYVEWSMRASATSANIFSRSLGAAIGTSALGSVLNLGLIHYAPPGSVEQIHGMLNHEGGLAAVAASPFQGVLYHAVELTFCGILLFSLGMVAASWFVPGNEVVFKRAPAAPR